MLVTPQTQTLTTGQTVKQLGRNTLGIARYALPNMIDNTTVLKNNSLIVSSLILVLSRIAVANFSALKAKGTPEGPYRYQESMRTTMREVGGFTLGFIVLRQLQAVIGKGLKLAYGIKDTNPSNPPTLVSQFNQNIKAFIKHQPLAKPQKWVDPAIESTFSYADNKASRATISFLQKLPGLAQTEGKTMIRGLYNWSPILLGSIPSVILAGFALEKLTRDKSDQVIDTVSRAFHHQPSFSANKPAAQRATNPFTPQ